MPTTHLWRLVERWQDEQRFRPSQAALARDIGVARSAVSQWKSGEARPKPDHMRAIQAATGIRYRDLLDALLQDMGYLPPSPTKPHGMIDPTHLRVTQGSETTDQERD